ncbi:MAG: hypothetical protein HFF38_09355 [Lawsonibacter sp.]|nr:hypothetical protein [Lawsonibacter sp.]
MRNKPQKNLRFGVLLVAAAIAAIVAIGFAVRIWFFPPAAVEAETVELSGIGLTLILPDSWKDAYGVEMNKDASGCSLYVKSIRESGGEGYEGRLFQVGKVYDEPLTPDELAAQSPMNCQYLFSTAEGTYALTFASDIQYDVSSPSQTEEYKRLKEGIPQIQYLLSMNES